MGVPDDHILCRFVRSKEWSTNTNGPLNGAFKGIRNKKTLKAEITNWDKSLMAQRGANIESLRTGNLENHPHTVYLKPSDYKNAAEEAEREKQEPCRISIQYTPHSVAPEQTPWAYAHLDVIEQNTEKTVAQFRENLRNRVMATRLCGLCDKIYVINEFGLENVCKYCCSAI